MNHGTPASFSARLLLGLLLPLILFATETLSAQEKVTTLKVDLATEILSLRSEEFTKRTDAEKNVLTWAEVNKTYAPSVLLGLHDESTHPEVRTRLFRILRKIQTPDFSQGFLGIQMGNLLALNRNEAIPPQGVEVIMAVEGGPAQKAGILPGDIITQVDDLKTNGINGSQALSIYVKSKKAGEQVRLHYLRQGKKKELLLTLDAYKENILDPFGSGTNQAKEREQEKAFQHWLHQERAAQAKPSTSK